MFTGIIQATGEITRIDELSGDRRFYFTSDQLNTTDLETGQSIAVNGVCLTIVECLANGFCADVSGETLSCTTFGQFSTGDRVNLEKPLQLSSRLDGHLVSGHVDGVVSIISHTPDARSEKYEFTVPKNLARYICKKGSVAIDGVSLTVNEIRDTQFSVNIIPHTMQHTIFESYQVGTRVNIEVDIIARYLESLAGYTS